MMSSMQLQQDAVRGNAAVAPLLHGMQPGQLLLLPASLAAAAATFCCITD
jgi:hypothetical protein